MKKGIIFDLDGTLIDSLEDIAINANMVLKELGYKEHNLESYKNFVGDGAKVLIENAMPKNSSELQIEEALELFKKYYEQALHKNTKLYEGIENMLNELVGSDFSLGVLSNKPHKFTKLYVEQLLGDIPFIEVLGQREDTPKKPHPIGALQIAQKFDIEPENIYFIGDTSTDIKTAKNANMIAVGVSWGFRSIDELLESGADYIINSPEELLKIVK